MPLLTNQPSRLLGRKASAAGNGLLANLIGYWGLDEAGGANDALDKHTNALTLAQTGSPGSAAGLVYAGARVTANGKYFARNSEALLQTGDIDVTVAAWIYPTSISAEAAILSKWGGTANEYLLEFNPTTSNKLTWAAGGSVNIAFSALNQWSLVVCWHDSVNNLVGISVNAGTPETAAHTTGINSSNGVFRIGAIQSALIPFAGRVGPVVMWKRVLSPTDRTALYNAGAGLTYAAFTA